MMQVVIVLVTM